jgi:hypothetical protein
LLRDLVEWRDRRADAEQQSQHAAAQPERLGDAARQPLAQSCLEGGQRLRDDLGTERRRRLKLLREVGRSCEPEQLRAVDVDDVERDGDPGCSARLGDELVGNEVRRHLFEDVGDLKRERQRAPELARRLEWHRRHARGRRGH